MIKNDPFHRCYPLKNGRKFTGITMRLPIATWQVIKVLFLTLASISILAGCASNKPQINMADEQNFASISTFYIKPPLNSHNLTVENHLAAVISSVLQSRGLQPADKDNADIEVGFFPSTALKEGGSSVNFGIGTGVFGRSSGISLGSIFSVPVGEQVTQYQNLQIEIVRNGSFIYSAAGTAELDSKDSISIQNALTNLVTELLAQYPQKSDNTAQPAQAGG